MENIHTTKSQEDYSKRLFSQLYQKGLSIAEIEYIGKYLVKVGKKALNNPKNTIARISNGLLEIE